jgi:hypothetical protein
MIHDDVLFSTVKFSLCEPQKQRGVRDLLLLERERERDVNRVY